MRTTAATRSWVWGFVALGTLTSAASGCSGEDLSTVRAEIRDGGAGGEGTGPIPMEEFPAELARAICENIGSCCTARAEPFSVKACEASVGARFVGSLSKGGDAGAYDPEEGRRCVDAFARDAKGCFAATDYMMACPGSKPPRAHARAGDACDADCFPNTGPGGYYCVSNAAPPASIGYGDAAVVAVPITQDTSGSACWASDGLYCAAPSAGARTCAHKNPVGGPCTEYNGCLDGWCDGTRCVTLRAAGSSCASTTECQKGLYCDGSAGDGTCQPRRPDGAACASSEECASESCDHQGSHTCVEPSLFPVFATFACVQ